MTTMKKSIHDNANGLDYTLVNDHYLPNLPAALHPAVFFVPAQIPALQWPPGLRLVQQLSARSAVPDTVALTSAAFRFSSLLPARRFSEHALPR